MKESAIQKQILDYLSAKGILAFRMQTGATLSSYKGKSRMVRYGVPGMADVLACPFDPCGDGVDRPCFLWIEVKAEGGRQTELQESFQYQVESHGHYYMVARSIDDLEGWV
jgi:hypothetical protein